MPVIELHAHPSDCPTWNYDEFTDKTPRPGRNEYLRDGLIPCMVAIRKSSELRGRLSRDTRAVHRRLFCNLTDNNYEYFAGNYRGSNFKCLRNYTVGVSSDPRVGIHPWAVESHMSQIADEMPCRLAELKIAAATLNAVISENAKLTAYVHFAAAIFELLLRVHPYADGNGHVARFVLWCLLGEFGYWPHKFRIEPRPEWGLDYTNAILQYRNGDKKWLISMIINSM
jgi:fido (protein-threonine AMPylation protein)